MANYWTVIVATLLVCHHFQIAQPLPTGAPGSACGDLLPPHSGGTIPPQTSPSPYIIKLSSSEVKGGETVTVTLETPDKVPPFKGYMARGGKTVGDTVAAGDMKKVAAEDTTLKTVLCDGGYAMTHSDTSSKPSVYFEWKAPNEPGDYVILATFAQAYDTFWVKQSTTIRVTPGSVTETTTTPAPSANALKKVAEIAKECGTNKGCFGIPNGCVQKGNCEMMAAWRHDGLNYRFELNGRISATNPNPEQGHVSMGLSFDTTMQDDSVIGCVYQGGRPEARSFYNDPTRHDNLPFPDKTVGISQSHSTDFIEGYVFCDFTRYAQFTHAPLTKTFNLDKDSYHILLARSPELEGDKLGYHVGSQNKDYTASPQAISLRDTDILGASTKGNILVQLHGALMVIAWVVTSSLGMFVARYYKQTHTGFTPLNKAFWFVTHLGCMFLTIGLTFVGVILIFFQVGGYSSSIPTPGGQAHPILGLILTGICALQLTIGLLRPHPGTPNRPIFNWVHWTAGNVGHIVGVACIFLATELSKSGVQGSLKWLLTVIVFVVFHVVMHVTLSIHTVWADKQMDAANRLRGISVGPMKPSKPEEAPGTMFRTFLLVLYIVGILAIAITLIALLVIANN